MADTSARTLRLLSLLQSHRHWNGSDLAERLAVSTRTLRRDVDRLRELGYPVDARRGVNGGYELAPGAALPPLVLDDEEAVALAVGMQEAIQGGTVAGIAEASVRVLAKIVQVMPVRLRRRIDALTAVTVPALWGPVGPSVDAEVLMVLAQACRDNERVEFAYTARGGEETLRHVEPHRLVLLGQRWYLVAFDLLRFDWRSFRVDRLVAPRGSGVSFGQRSVPSGDAAAFVRDGINQLADEHHVKVLVHASGSAVRDRIGRWVTVEDVTDDRCLIRMTTDALQWPAFVLGAVAADFDVVEPAELGAYVGEWGRRFARAATPSRGSVVTGSKGNVSPASP